VREEKKEFRVERVDRVEKGEGERKRE